MCFTSRSVRLPPLCMRRNFSGCYRAGRFVLSCQALDVTSSGHSYEALLLLEIKPTRSLFSRLQGTDLRKFLALMFLPPRTRPRMK